MLKIGRIVLMTIGLLTLQAFYFEREEIEVIRQKEEVLSIVDKTQTKEVEIRLPESFEVFLNDEHFREMRNCLYLQAKIFIESSGDPLAYNPGKDYIGLLQIKRVMVRETNNILQRRGDSRRFVYDDRLCADKSTEMYHIVMSHHNPEFCLWQASCVWNAGHRYERLRSMNRSRALQMVTAYHNRILRRMEYLYNNKINNND